MAPGEQPISAIPVPLTAIERKMRCIRYGNALACWTEVFLAGLREIVQGGYHQVTADAAPTGVR